MIRGGAALDAHSREMRDRPLEPFGRPGRRRAHAILAAGNAPVLSSASAVLDASTGSRDPSATVTSISSCMPAAVPEFVHCRSNVVRGSRPVPPRAAARFYSMRPPSGAGFRRDFSGITKSVSKLHNFA